MKNIILAVQDVFMQYIHTKILLSTMNDFNELILAWEEMQRNTHTHISSRGERTCCGALQAAWVFLREERYLVLVLSHLNLNGY